MKNTTKTSQTNYTQVNIHTNTHTDKHTQVNTHTPLTIWGWDLCHLSLEQVLDGAQICPLNKLSGNSDTNQPLKICTMGMLSQPELPWNTSLSQNNEQT